MSYRLIPHRFLHLYAQRSSRFSSISHLLNRPITTNVRTDTSMSNRRWFLRRYLFLIGLPVSVGVAYRLSTKPESRRKHRIVLGSIVRAIRAISVGLQSVIDQKTSLLFKREGTDEYVAALHACRRRNAKRFADFCIDAGGVYVKIGQVFINLPEVVPLEYYEELQVLQEHALRREKGEIDVLFKRYFRDPPEAVYSKFDREPIAAASLAEVYKAESKDGQGLAIKVQYCDLRERHETDIATV